ncbi:bifunctional folylpolyglutamate synthase/dihydrofolate synthase [Fischerella thermalis]|uniref:tetrahydrofolate synthase n=1 Tax=Fischerella thermalis JSC-11 TaxID=741277 RepID=G6FUW8_9CYAN|nr:folylpolyglutamate synthase/dihydrofolate synthase family protein [Fischerella thermalis]PMB10093.1 bifunctional folylpolyglutamate synthase/dihydrofolate synthase [Fischerella thermalis CCMEE 5328]EHC13048.1 FolC bifunctional protein [Fischerella thermalis JSC-11]PLZ06766.1 bifunctional folylpolyglutamate synthase/dihydrofolate synthase [Fischerella thermalis WC119]PLZ07452.1 bifunctional folylpolyglutamate synthase/dihydrofolate synthase [Fischerella thermalis WC114]PLZ15902.1 bifunctiona
MDIDSLLQPFQQFGVRLGLDSSQKLLANLGNPHHQVPVIHVAGTNGKGSVCAYISSVLTEAGYRTGRYISPHLVDWTERICINQQPISSKEFCKLLQEVKAAIFPNDDLPTQFEVITTAAWLYFAQEKVDVAVVEVGLGGRLDATNVCEQPLITVITSISREHWQRLGPTVADIAREKAGILKVGCPAVIGPLPPDAEQVVRSRVLELQCPIYTPQPARQIAAGWAEYERLGGGEKGHPIKYPLPLQGQIQLTNSAIALCALEILQQKGWQISEQAIINGMAKTQWPGRMQWINWKNYKLLLDGAHNPAAAQVLRNYVDILLNPREADIFPFFDTPSKIGVTWVMGMLSTKDHQEIFQALLRPNDQLYLVPVPNHSSANPEELAKLARDICPELSICNTFPDVTSALEAAFSSTDDLVVLCGSLYLIGHFLKELRANS